MLDKAAKSATRFFGLVANWVLRRLGIGTGDYFLFDEISKQQNEVVIKMEQTTKLPRLAFFSEQQVDTNIRVFPGQKFLGENFFFNFCCVLLTLYI